MTVYVDELRIWPHARYPFQQGSCHLTADDADELHDFAERIGLRRAWYQQHALMPHYDLTPGRRARALHLGAVFVRAREQVLRARQRRAAEPTP